MKKLALSILALLSVGSLSFGATNASDNASNSTYQPGNVWDNGSNGGTGFGPWDLSKTGTGGRYIGGTALGATTFGIYSGTSGTSRADRAFTGALSAGQTFSITLAHTETNNGELGINLLEGTNVRLVLKMVSGQSQWKMWDGGAGGDFSIGQNYVANTALTFQFTYNGGSSYSYSFGSASGNNTATSVITNLTGFRIYNNGQGDQQNLGFNNITVVPEPTTWALLAGGLTALVVFRRRRAS